MLYKTRPSLVLALSCTFCTIKRLVQEDYELGLYFKNTEASAKQQFQDDPFLFQHDCDHSRKPRQEKLGEKSLECIHLIGLTNENIYNSWGKFSNHSFGINASLKEHQQPEVVTAKTIGH